MDFPLWFYPVKAIFLHTIAKTVCQRVHCQLYPSLGWEGGGVGGEAEKLDMYVKQCDIYNSSTLMYSLVTEEPLRSNVQKSIAVITSYKFSWYWF